jgi:hypothetical protein
MWQSFGDEMTPGQLEKEKKKTVLFVQYFPLENYG